MFKKIIEEIFIKSSKPDEFYKNFIKMLSQENIKEEDLIECIFEKNKEKESISKAKLALEEASKSIIQNTSKLIEKANAPLNIIKTIESTEGLKPEIINKIKKELLNFKMDLEKTARELQNQIEELKKTTQNLCKDPLTDLYSRSMMDVKLKEQFYLLKRYNLTFSLIMIDLDDFKHINDAYGHTAGDSVLKYIGQFIKSSLRQSDFPIRYGGDEFLIILPNTNIHKAYAVAQKLLKQVNNYQFKKQGSTFSVHLSIGIAQAQPNDTVSSIIEKADNALYESKRLGKNTISLQSCLTQS
jgi:diguanylate cyclase